MIRLEYMLLDEPTAMNKVADIDISKVKKNGG